MSVAQAVRSERLLSVLQDIALRQQSGRLSVMRVGTEETGEIFFIEGDTVFARTEQDLGEMALLRMMSWREVAHTFSALARSAQAARGDTGQLEQRALRRQALLPLRQTDEHASSGELPIVDSRSAEQLRISDEETIELPSLKLPAAPAQHPRPLRAQAAMLRPMPTAPTPARSWKSSGAGAISRQQTGEMFQVSTELSVEKDVASTTGSWSAGELVTQTDASGEARALYRAIPAATSSQVLQSLGRKERVTLMLLDGKRSLGEVASLLHHTLQETAQALEYLRQQGYIEYCGTKTAWL